MKKSTDRDMTQPEGVAPPRWPLNLLRYFVKREYIEEIEGDMEEIFHDNVERLSPRKASRLYTWEVLKLFRPTLLKNLSGLPTANQYPMFKNYFKTAIRGLMKTPMTSFINVVGLSIALGICVFAYTFARWTISTDQFHKNKDEVFLVTFNSHRDGTMQQYGQTPRPLGVMLKSDFANIKKMCRVEDRNVVMKHEDKVFHERVRFTDPEFLDMFTFPLKWGTPSSLSDINSIVLSERMAIKYFGAENPLGQSILVKFDKDNGKAFKVVGVAATFPKSRTISFDFLVNVENLSTAEPGYDFNDWKALVHATLIQVDDASSAKAIEGAMDKYRKFQNQAVDEDLAISSFKLEPLATLHEASEHIKDDISRSSHDNYLSVIFLSVIAVFLLALACINYINIAIVSAAKRLKEIGVRKTIGASRTMVVVQFLTENIVITFFALIIGVILGITIFIPGFEQLWHFNMGFTFTDAALWIYLPSILLFTAIASGIYPAFYVSRFEVINILKGSVQFGKKNPVTKLFLGIQLVLACIFITSAVMFSQNSTYLASRSWGYNQDAVLYIEVPDLPALEKISAVMTSNSNVQSLSGSHNHVGVNNSAVVVKVDAVQHAVDQLAVDAQYFTTLGIPLQQGRVFRDRVESDKQSVVVNESFVGTMGWEQPIGQIFKIDTIQYDVIGVVSDFHSYSFNDKVTPMLFTVANREDYHFLSMRVRAGSEKDTYAVLQAQWAKLFPENPFQGGYQEDVWGNYFTEIWIHAMVWKVFGFIAVLLATLGLYGLMTLNVTGRVREFSIRKVLGAGIKNIAAIITREYAVLFAVALLIGAPVSYILAKMLMDFAYAYHVPVTYSVASISVVVLILVLFVTAFTQIRKVVKSNPVNGLKME
ncbi:MAG TPA: FtsX-like permease family protein [Chryseolinea sp.]|nr:FtsX-like permease family protein [Chryseolinea sp.]